MPHEVMADQIQFVMDHETFQRFEKTIEAPLDPAAAEALARLLAHRPAWEA